MAMLRPFAFLAIPIFFALFGLPQAAFLAPDSSQIRYTGRFDFSQPEKPRFDWPACVIEAAFTGTMLTILMSGGQNNFNVYVDGVRQPDMVLTNGKTAYPIEGPLDSGAHVLRLTKRTEGFNGIATFGGLEVDSNQGEAALPPRPTHRLLFIGDSFSAGYGAESDTVDCGDQKRTYDNADTAFCALTARALDAEYSILAISGIGMVHNSGDTLPQSKMPFPSFFERTLFNQPDLKFRDSTWLPEVIVIALGNNDFSSRVKPSLEQYATAYKNFHKVLRAAYPKVPILCVAFGDDRLQTTYIPAIVEDLTQQGDSKITHFQMPSMAGKSTGCNYHPNVVGQQKLADALIPEMSKLLGIPVSIPWPRRSGEGPKRRTATQYGWKVLLDADDYRNVLGRLLEPRP